MGAEVRHPAGSRPFASKRRSVPVTTRVRGKSGSWPPKQHLLEMPDPAHENLPDIVAHRNKIGWECFREFCPHLAGVLLNQASVNIHVPETQRRERIVPGPGHEREGDKARSRFSTSVPLGMVSATCRICSMDGTGLPRAAFAMAVSFSESAKYSAST
jgi:hypothetical protein